MRGSILHPRYSLGLPILDQGSDYRMEFLPYRKEGEKALASSAHLSSLGNLEGDEPYSV